MKLGQRILVMFMTFIWATILFWYFGSLWFYILPVLGIAYVIVGGKINV